jgi:nicastrin
MYPTHGGSGGCYKLLHARGESGCWSAAAGSLLGPEDAPLAMWLPPAEPPSASASAASQRSSSSPPLPSSPVVLVALAGDAPALLARLSRGYADEEESEDARLARLVRGVIVVDRAAAAAADDAVSPVAPPSHYTSLPPFPYGAEYAPADSQQQHAWNPRGLPELDPLSFRLPVPVIAVPGAAAAAAAGATTPAAKAALAFARDALRRAASNDAAAVASGSTINTRSRARHRATLSLGMTARSNSSACLASGACKPLGGFSVLAVLPPRPPVVVASSTDEAPPATRRRRSLSGADEEKEPAKAEATTTMADGGGASSPSATAAPPPLLLVVAQTDGYDLFHDLIRGSDAPLSGLIAMLAAAYALRESAKEAAAADASSPSPWPALFTRRVAFLALAGEPWGYMGSRRFLYELDSGNATWAEAALGPGASLADVSAVIEVGQVGRAAGAAEEEEAGGEGSSSSSGKKSNTSSSKRQFFLHTRGDAGESGDLPLSLTQAFQQAAAEDGGAADATVAARPSGGGDSQSPGLPPSSLYSFARVLPKPQAPLALLAEFDDRMDARNPYFGGGRFDAGVQQQQQQQEGQPEGLDAASVSSAALLLASALRRLALPASAPSPNATAVRALVESYASCLAADVPGLACPMAGALMGPDAGPGAAAPTTTAGGAAPPTPSIPLPPRYVGVLQALPTPQPYGREYASPARKDPLARFVWGALVASTMADDDEKGERCVDAAAAERCVASGRVCAAPPATADSVFFGGPCVNAFARYVPSYSLRVACAEGCGNGSSSSSGGADSASSSSTAFRWGEAIGDAAAAADAWMRRYGWPEDPMWTESDWPYGVPSVRLYLADAPGAEAAALVVGVAATAAAALGGWWLRRRLVRAHVVGWAKR